jgi:LCP family protein required for cell wall assembly
MRVRTQQRKKLFKRIGIGIILILFIFFGRFILEAIRYSPVLVQLATHNTINLKKTSDNKINVLILGTGGGTHDGPNLTDTIIFANIDPAPASGSAKTTLVSIPRDLWVPELKGKINQAYSNGEDIKKGGGLLLAKAMIGKIINQKIDYAIRIDFAGFVKAVDEVGGLDVTVDRTLDDYAYPVTGKEDETCGHTEDQIKDLAAQVATGSATDLESFPCRYEHLHVAAGEQHLDGELALKYVRSRHALGIEGSDFARSKRQEKVINAFKEKVFSVGTLLNPLRLSQLYDVLKGSIDTDVTQDEYDDFIRLAQKMKSGQISSFVIDTGDTALGRPALLYNPTERGEDTSPFGGAWVLTPTAGNGNYTQVQSYVACLLKGGICSAPTKAPAQ